MKLRCSPRCGFGCTQAAYDQATFEAGELCSRLGQGWQPVVWENTGWNYFAKKGAFMVWVRTTGAHIRGGWSVEGYCAEFNIAGLQLLARSETPESALGFLVQDVRTMVSKINAHLDDLMCGEADD